MRNAMNGRRSRLGRTIQAYNPITIARLKKGWSQAQASLAAGVPMYHFGIIERQDSQRLSAQAIFDASTKMASALNIPLESVCPSNIPALGPEEPTQEPTVRLSDCLAREIPPAPATTNPVELAEIAVDTHAAIRRLTKAQQVAIRLRFGLDGDGEKTLKVIGKAIGTGRERARQVICAGLRKLARHPVLKKYKD